MEKEHAGAVDIELLFRNISTQDDERSFRKLFEYYYPALCLYACLLYTSPSPRDA